MLFEINKYDKCEVSGLVDICITCNDGAKIEPFNREFTKELDAYKYIYSTAKSVLCQRLQNYLVAINKISGLGVEYWHTQAKEESRKWLWKILPELFDKELDDICKNILHFKDRLWQVMPGEKHRAYSKLRDDVTDIIMFAKQNTTFKITNNLVKMEVA